MLSRVILDRGGRARVRRTARELMGARGSVSVPPLYAIALLVVIIVCACGASGRQQSLTRAGAKAVIESNHRFRNVEGILLANGATDAGVTEGFWELDHLSRPSLTNEGRKVFGSIEWTILGFVIRPSTAATCRPSGRRGVR